MSLFYNNKFCSILELKFHSTSIIIILTMADPLCLLNSAGIKLFSHKVWPMILLLPNIMAILSYCTLILFLSHHTALFCTEMLVSTPITPIRMCIISAVYLCKAIESRISPPPWMNKGDSLCLFLFFSVFLFNF